MVKLHYLQSFPVHCFVGFEDIVGECRGRCTFGYI